jgi:hypothetical protein
LIHDKKSKYSFEILIQLKENMKLKVYVSLKEVFLTISGHYKYNERKGETSSKKKLYTRCQFSIPHAVLKLDD